MKINLLCIFLLHVALVLDIYNVKNGSKVHSKYSILSLTITGMAISIYTNYWKLNFKDGLIVGIMIIVIQKIAGYFIGKGKYMAP